MFNASLAGIAVVWHVTENAKGVVFFPNEKYTKKLVDVWYPRQVYQVLPNFPKPRKSYEWCSGADFPLGASRPQESIRICPRKLWVNHQQAVYNSLQQ